MPRTAIIIGAGPAGLTAAHELARRSDLRPIVLEQDDQVGGLSRTVRHAGNRIDIGGHRFFSQSDRVMSWWLDRLPLQAMPPGELSLAYQGRLRRLATDGAGPDPRETDRVMLLRPRRSRILHGGRFFPYPLALSATTLANLGMQRSARIGLSYGRARLRPRPEDSLEDFLINRFGRSLYRTFFRDYTAKVWGRPCEEISAEWGAQRIKGLSLRRALSDAAGKMVGREGSSDTSLIEQFLYPKLGPGQLWEVVAEEVEAAGGEVRTGWRVEGIEVSRSDDGRRRVAAVQARAPDGTCHRLAADLCVSTMPLRTLLRGVTGERPPDAVAEAASGLEYRDFLTVGLLLDDLAMHEADGSPLRDNWIYVQEPGVQVGRVQLFHNWSPWMVADPATSWIGLEYFATEGDALWSRTDAQLAALARQEAALLGLARPDAVRDAVVVRAPKAYPGYFGGYEKLPQLRAWLDGVDNLVPVGRNGMHRYNNQDHSMLAAMVAVDGIVAGRLDRDALWAVNAEERYHETAPER